jgi:transcriptional regulator with XRE-family HTH domain
MRRRRDRAITEEDMRRRVRINVRARREAESLTLKQVAVRVKMHPRHWQKVEAGTVNITLLTLVRLGVALGVDPVRLLEEPAGRGPGPSGS